MTLGYCRQRSRLNICCYIGWINKKSVFVNSIKIATNIEMAALFMCCACATLQQLDGREEGTSTSEVWCRCSVVYIAVKQSQCHSWELRRWGQVFPMQRGAAVHSGCRVRFGSLGAAAPPIALISCHRCLGKRGKMLMGGRCGRGGIDGRRFL